MADVDIDPFGEHDRTESRTDETGENAPLSLVTPRRKINLGTRMRTRNIIWRPQRPCSMEESLKELNS